MINEIKAQEMSRLNSIFHPYANSQIQGLGGKRFVHYTNAATAFSILKNKQMWLRNAMAMNDFSEIEWGKFCVDAALNSGAGKGFANAINSISDELYAESVNGFYGDFPEIQKNSFIACVAEHEDGEDRLGRLSMWRAYGNVALVFRNSTLTENWNSGLGIQSTPVAYLTPDKAIGQIAEISRSVIANLSFLQTIPRDILISVLKNLLRLAVLAIKHPGFEEEREWRLIYTEGINISVVIERELEVIAGCPQFVCKLPLKNNARFGITGSDLSQLIDRIIIGPADHSALMRQAFICQLEELGVLEAAAKVSVSEIPLRR